MDFTLSDQGSIWLLIPRTDDAVRFAKDMFAADTPRWGLAIVVEPRFVEGIVREISEDCGFTVEVE